MTTETQVEMITVKVDGKEVDVPKGTLIIRAAEKAGVHIPRFCDHPLLKPAAACRQCLVEVAMPNREGAVSKMPKPQPACAVTVAPQMEVFSAQTSEVSEKAQCGVLEFLLINHPMDCPVCDKGGECPLQNQALSDGRSTSRFVDIKRTYPKPISVSSQILLDRDRCILCQRCTRFSTQIAGDAFVQLQGRGGGTPGYETHTLHGSQIGNFDAATLDFADDSGTHVNCVENEFSGPQGRSGISGGHYAGPVGNAEMDVNGRPFASYFSGNVIQICPVGALTSASYRFRARPFDLVSVDSVTEHDASGSALRVDYRRGAVVRRLAGEDELVNEDWITDKDRFAFRWQTGADRLKFPQVNGENVSWFEALDTAAENLRKAKRVGVLVGGRLPVEDVYAYAKFARVALGTNDIDFRTSAGSEEENQFLAATVAGSGLGVTYADIEKAAHVLTVGFEAEDECGSVFLRLRKGVLAKQTSVSVMSSFETYGTKKMMARFIPVKPGAEANTLDAVTENDPALGDLYADLAQENSVILVGERLAQTAGALSAVLRLVQRTGAKLAWIPRRAGDRGAIDAGALPNLLPGGRPVAEEVARANVAQIWGVDTLPATRGKNTAEILAACRSGEIDTLLLAGVELADLPVGAQEALETAYVVQLEVRKTPTSEFANVLLPVAPPVEKGGTFVNWEGRMRPFGQVLTSTELPDRRVLNDLAQEMGFDLGLHTLKDVVEEYAKLRNWDGVRVSTPNVVANNIAGSGVVLSTWKQMLDAGSLQSFEPYLANTARKPIAVMSPATAEKAEIKERVKVSTNSGSLIFAVALAQMPDDVVWVPQNAVGVPLYKIGATAGDVVTLENAEVK